MLNRNLIVLVLCQAVSVGGTVLLVTIGGLAGATLAPEPALATLPMSIMVVGTASGTVPAAMLMQRIGRRYGFITGLLIAACGMQLASLALNQGHFVLFCLAAGMVGFSTAFSQQYRFAAAESVAIERVSQAVSIVLVGSIGGALLGPELAKATVAGINPHRWAFNVIAALYITAAFVMLLLKSSTPVATDGDDRPPLRSPVGLLAQPLFLLAVLSGVVGQSVMTLIMTATPLSMHLFDGFTLDETADVIRMHVLAMFVPALFSGLLIARFGIAPIMYTGIAIMVAMLLMGLAGHEYLHYSASMIALGVGWNFLFVAGTTLLVKTHRTEERYRAQALNDFSVFGGSALASLGAGTLLYSIGWEGILYVASPLVLLLFVFLVRARGDHRLAPASSAVGSQPG